MKLLNPIITGNNCTTDITLLATNLLQFYGTECLLTIKYLY